MQIILQTAQAAFLDVTVFVGAVLIIFGYINYKKGGALIKSIEKHKKWQPLLGALLGLTPGCGGAILIMPLYVRKSVTFGTVIATLIATLGDSAFVLISTVPLTFIKVTIITSIIGIITGYIVDYLKIGVKKSKNPHTQAHDHKPNPELKHIGHEEGDEIDIELHHKQKAHPETDSFGHKLTHQGYVFYWAILAIGLVIAIPRLFLIEPQSATLQTAIITLGAVGTALSIILMIAGKKFLAEETHEEEEMKLTSFKETLVHNAQDTAFVGVWVFVAYFAYEMIVIAVGGEPGGGQEGLLAVAIGALIGIIPVCSPQIIFASFFVKGLLPFGALIAQSISQDGDALLPLLALDKKAALLATVITTAVGFLVGSAFYLL